MRFLRRLVSAFRSSSPSPVPPHSRTTLSYSDRVRAIHELDTGFIHHRLVHRDWLDSSLANSAIIKYKELLKKALDLHGLGNLNSRTLRPDPLTDKAWHAHVLHTKRYRDDCMRVLWFYLEHVPDDPREVSTTSHISSSRRRREETSSSPSSSSCSWVWTDISIFGNPTSPLSSFSDTGRSGSKASHCGDISIWASESSSWDSSWDSSGGSSCGWWSSCGGWCGGWD